MNWNIVLNDPIPTQQLNFQYLSLIHISFDYTSCFVSLLIPKEKYKLKYNSALVAAILIVIIVFLHNIANLF